MKPATAIILLLFCAITAKSQADYLLVKKKNKTIDKLWMGSVIAFQTENKQWYKGEITRIKNDSFYIRPKVVRYSLMRVDSFYFPIQGFRLADIYAMPKRGLLIDYVDGRFQVSPSGGHMHFYWIKSGLIFRLGAAGYALVGLINGAPAAVAFAAPVFLAGVLLKKIYSPIRRIKGKYRVVSFTI